ncbi:hypothetical protein GCM10010960_14800 [Arenimonas maotaiensis]|uniref:Uncharacterized protein n=1 Tax=Arenimonas maotaiensis TaxID=1446479 RepID=A0A917CMX1_9GAMM|nr:hypothetical protein [Arenimonas maotaiensis]GGF94080.1 hypothetical protein GCM10010960_14800 [Arenimonas maotaiensis]
MIKICIFAEKFKCEIKSILSNNREITIIHEDQSPCFSSLSLSHSSDYILLFEAYSDSFLEKDFQVLKETLSSNINLKAVIIYDQINNLFIKKLLDAGVFGFVEYSQINNKLISALHRVFCGYYYLNNDLKSAVFKKRRALNYVESQVLKLLLDGENAQQISHKINIEIKDTYIIRARLMEIFESNNLNELKNKVTN